MDARLLVAERVVLRRAWHENLVVSLLDIVSLLDVSPWHLRHATEKAAGIGSSAYHGLVHVSFGWNLDGTLPQGGAKAHHPTTLTLPTNGAGGAAPTQVQAHQPEIPVGGGGSQAAGHVVVADAVEAITTNALLPPCHGQQFNGVQGGLVVERGQGDEGLQGRQLALVNPLALLKPFTAVDNAMPNGSDGEAFRQGRQHSGQPTGQGVPPPMVKTEGLLLPGTVPPAPAQQTTRLGAAPVNPGLPEARQPLPSRQLQQSQLMAGAAGIHHKTGGHDGGETRRAP